MDLGSNNRVTGSSPSVNASGDESQHCLPDVLAPDLDIVFVGTAAGKFSEATQKYYAKAGNVFWPTMRTVGLVPREFAAEDFRHLLQLGMGLTDLCKQSSGPDKKIIVTARDLADFDDKLTYYRPRAIAFTGKRAASLWLHRRTGKLRYGLQPRRDTDVCEVFVLPSTSAAARRYWKIEPWHELVDWLRATKPWRF